MSCLTASLSTCSTRSRRAGGSCRARRAGRGLATRTHHHRLRPSSLSTRAPPAASSPCKPVTRRGGERRRAAVAHVGYTGLNEGSTACSLASGPRPPPPCSPRSFQLLRAPRPPAPRRAATCTRGASPACPSRRRGRGHACSRGEPPPWSRLPPPRTRRTLAVGRRSSGAWRTATCSACRSRPSCASSPRAGAGPRDSARAARTAAARRVPSSRARLRAGRAPGREGGDRARAGSPCRAGHLPPLASERRAQPWRRRAIAQAPSGGRPPARGGGAGGAGPRLAPAEPAEARPHPRWLVGSQPHPKPTSSSSQSRCSYKAAPCRATRLAQAAALQCTSAPRAQPARRRTRHRHPDHGRFSAAAPRPELVVLLQARQRRPCQPSCQRQHRSSACRHNCGWKLILTSVKPNVRFLPPPKPARRAATGAARGDAAACEHGDTTIGTAQRCMGGG